MHSRKKADNTDDIASNKSPASGSFASVMQATKKPKTTSIDHNMVFVSYLVETQMSDHLEGRQVDTPRKKRID